MMYSMSAARGCRRLAWGRAVGAVLLLSVAHASDTCAADSSDASCAAGIAKNRIIAENRLTGAPSTEWDINGAGDPTIQGFATDISINAGETVQFKIRTDALAYRIDIYRMGYYGGAGARLVATMQPSVPLPQQQPDCLSDAETLLIDCANWAVSAQWQSPADAVSGIYFARLVRTDPEGEIPNWRADKSPVLSDPKFARQGSDFSRRPNGSMATHAYGVSGHGSRRNALREPRASHIYFLVRDDAHNSAILLQTMDTTWQAYNCWGSTNTYGVPCDSPSLHAGSPTPLNTSRRAHKTSYNRPFATRSYRAVNMVFNAEYPLVRWLERNGYDVSYWTGLDADRYGEQLLTSGHKIYISPAHDEYWSGRQRQFVTQARDRGLSLCFFSGNEVYWRIRWEPDSDGKPHRTLVVYKDTQSTTKLDPMPNEWTGTFRDGRDINPLGGQPENELTGTIFTVNAWRSDFLEVPAEFGRLRFWRNTSIAALPPGQTKTIPVAGLLGHEWDEDIDNGHRPPGLIRLSKTTVDNVQYIQDEGSTYDTGTATHHLTMYRHPKSGALVFGAGTCQWSWGLDGNHDQLGGLDVRMGQNCYSLRVSRDQLVGDGNSDIQQVTMNMFADMGVLPQAPLAPGLVMPVATSDRSPPSLAAGIKLLEGSELVAGVLVGGAVTDVGGGVVAAVEVSEDDGKTWHPADLELSTGHWKYRLSQPATVLGLRAADDSGNLAEELGLRPRPA